MYSIRIVALTKQKYGMFRGVFLGYKSTNLLENIYMDPI